MTKSIHILVNILLTTSALYANGGMVYIGQFEGNYYYVSPNSVTWSRAHDDGCSSHLGAHLVAIETEAEWDFLTLALENYGFGTTYWTSGMYDPSRSLWKWTKNDEALLAFAPWGPGFPSTPEQLLRVQIYFTNRYDTYWRTVHSTQLHRYICEVNFDH